MGLQLEITAVIVAEAESQDEIGRRHKAHGFVRPFHEAQGPLAEIIIQPSIDKLFRRLETIKIKVIQV
jgi:hypothetical protein